ncbi:hypothetical protein [Hydrogenimonas sp.]
MKRKIAFSLFLCLALSTLTGCLKEQPKTPDVQTVAYEEPEPAWYRQPPQADERFFYAVGEGDTVEAAAQAAVAGFKARFVSETAMKLLAKVNQKEGVVRHLPKSALAEVEKLLRDAEVPYEVQKSEKLGQKRAVALVAVDRQAYARPLKKETMRRLVAVEERWHRAGGANALERYKLAEDSYRKMQTLLPWYLAANAIAPFSDKVAKRVEQGTPYFAYTAKRLKKRLKFCVEPVQVPALKLFAKAVEEGLESQRLVTKRPGEATKEVLCITVTGKLVHDRQGDRHIVDADIALKLHERYKAPVVVQRYRVRGVSDQSGTAALEMAAEALRKEVEKKFLLSV